MSPEVSKAYEVLVREMPDEVLSALAERLKPYFAGKVGSDPLLRAVEAAQRLGLKSRDEIYALVRSGELHGFKRGRRLFIRRSEVDRFATGEAA